MNTNCQYLEYCNDDTVKPDVVSYGTKKGKFFTNNFTMQKYALDKRYNELYCFVPVKTEYYVLMWDFDLKVDGITKLNNEKKFCTNEQLGNYIDEFDNIVFEIINSIINSLKKIFIEPDTQYIIADKNIGCGYHLYFPNIIISKLIHSYIYNDVLKYIISLKKYHNEIINHIFDACISKANGLRYFYYHYNGNYYKPNLEFSTFQFDEEPKNNFKYCLINTQNKSPNLKLNIDIEEINNHVHKINKKDKENDTKNNIVKDEIEYVTDFVYLDLGDKKSLFLKLINILNIKRFDDYVSWICLIYLFKTYGLYDEIVEFSKKSKKWNNRSLDIIIAIFKKETVPKKMLTFGTLIKWASDDDFMKTVELLEEFNIHIKLNISNVNDILLMHNKDKINYKEESRYISDDAVKKIIANIENDDNDVILMQSPTDSGKSTTLVKICYSIKKYKYTTLCLTSRISMVSTLKTVFNYKKDKKGVLTRNNDFNFNSYLDKDINSLDDFISSLEHLFIFKQFYDVIILDEIFSLCSHLYSKTLEGRRKECLIHLQNLISNAKLVIGCDAQIADICFSMFDNKKIFFYQNNKQNKLDIPMKIYVPKYTSEDSNLTHIASIMGEKYCKNNKSVIIFSDRKKTTNKLLLLLKKYNNNEDYFRIFNAQCGTRDDLNNIDVVSKNRCMVVSPKVIYGIDITTQYDDIFCVYSKPNGTDSMNSFEWYQQLSRARNCKIVNVYILDKNVNDYYNRYVSFELNKKEEARHLEHYTYYTNEIYKKYKKTNEVTSVNTYFKNIHYYKSWYDRIFSSNKLQILRLLAIQFGFTITEHEFEAIKVKPGLNKLVKLNNDMLAELGMKILNNEKIDEKYKNYEENVREQIKNRQKYLGKNDPIDILVDENKFDLFMKRKLLNLNREQFDKKILKLNDQDLQIVMKDDLIYNQIENLFWLEKQLNINRYEVDKIDKNIDVETFKKILEKNLDKMYYLYMDRYGRGRKYIDVQNKKILEKMISHNNIQKYYVNCVNNICDKVFKTGFTFKNDGKYKLYTFVIT